MFDKIIKDKVNKESPVKIATASLNFLWVVGLPLLNSSLSIEGRSSWTSEYACTISIEAATLNALSFSTPNNSEVFKTKKGLNLFPDDKIEYSIALKSFFSKPLPFGRKDLSALLISNWEISNSFSKFISFFLRYLVVYEE